MFDVRCRDGRARFGQSIERTDPFPCEFRRRALEHVREQVDGFDWMQVPTVSRFFAGKPTSLPIALTILDKLNLNFEEVFTPINLDTL